MNGRKRKIQIKFYVTEEERALIEQKMKLVPTQNMAAHLRKIPLTAISFRQTIAI